MELLRAKNIDFDNLFKDYSISREFNRKIKQKPKHQITDEEWEQCKTFFNYCCAYCGKPENKEIMADTLIREHVDNFGSNYLDNCAPACLSCNSTKRNNKFEPWYRSMAFFSEQRLQKVYKWLNSN